MKLTARKDINLDNDYVDVRYRELTPTIHKIFQLCEDTGSVLLCEKDGATHKVDMDDILYIESIDRKSCVYTKEDVFIMSMPLSQLEESLNSGHFIRINRMTVANIYKVKSVANSLDLRKTAEMVNGEKIVVSRHYRHALSEAIEKLVKEIAK